jgi:hypothetical protein
MSPSKTAGSWMILPNHMVIPSLVGGWPTPLKNDGVKVSWGKSIPNMMGKIKNVPNHQPEDVWV